MILARVALVAAVMLGPVLAVAAGVRAYEAWSVPSVLRGPGPRPVPGQAFHAEVGIIVVTVDGLAAPPPDDLLLASVVTDPTSAAGFYRAVSDGRWTISARIVDHVSVPGAADCPIEAWGRHALDAARAHRARMDDVTNLVFALPPNAECSAAGWAETSGRMIWLIGAVPPVAVIHELAHNWGAGHASTTGCDSGAGGIVASSCTDEYGDPFDVMGSGWGMGILNRVAIGLAAPEAIADVTGPGLFRLAALGSGGAEGLRFTAGPRDPGDVVLELRLPGPLEASHLQAPGRVLAHRPGAAGSTLLIDAHPETATSSDAGLAPGESLPLPGDRWVTVRAIGRSSALLEVGGRPD